ncbi:DUF308 domain-containing protein [Aerococcaceae bacterium DSM 111020]|nr:DUF308 domain-containing protein [Aerococcaceae bacterium DSM 111020]
MKRHEQGFSWWYLILGVIQLIIAYMLFNNIGLATQAFVYFLAFGAILNGIFLLMLRQRINEKTYQSTWSLVLFGVIAIGFGLLLLFNTRASLLAIPIIVSMMMISEAVSILMQAFAARRVGFNGWFWFNLIIGILGLILGFLLLFNPLAAYIAVEYLVGLYFIIFGIRNILSAF